VAAKLRTDKVAEAITPIVTKVANDPEVREHAKRALDSAKTVYVKVQSDGARKAAADKKVQDEVVRAAAELRTGAAKLSDTGKKHRGRTFMKLLIGAALAAAAFIGVKKAIASDEDEFEYTP
jgi:hypothetical protein